MKTKKFTKVVIRSVESNLDETVGELIGVHGWSHRTPPTDHKYKPGYKTFVAFFNRFSSIALDNELRRLSGFGTTFHVEQYFAPGDPLWDTFKI